MNRFIGQNETAGYQVSHLIGFIKIFFKTRNAAPSKQVFQESAEKLDYCVVYIFVVHCTQMGAPVAYTMGWASIEQNKLNLIWKGKKKKRFQQ